MRSARGIAQGAKSLKLLLYSVCFIYIFSCLLFYANCLAEEQTIITSDKLEYNKKTFTYIAQGNVMVQKDDATIEADEMIYNEHTGDVVAKGSVTYTDSDTHIQASRIELNLNTKTGKLYDAEIILIKDNYHITGSEIEKRGDKYYTAPEARFTTCDGPNPEWCFKGKDITLVAGKELKAKNVSFRIKSVPILYSPYLKIPFLSERKSGFLTPSVGYSKSLGTLVRIPFFWAISESRDATFIMDVYTKRGIGEGIEYRYIKPKDISGNWWLYHIRDNRLKKRFFEVTATHQQRSTDGLGGYLSINYVNEVDFFREFELELEARSNRFLESTGELTYPFTNSRLYLLSQYWVDLKEEGISTPQRLPEAGFVLHPTNIGAFWISATTIFSNFWRDEGVYGQRIDIYPQIYQTFGSDIAVMQRFGARGTAYSLKESEEDFLHREDLEYEVVVNTRLFKRYKSFTHVLEPSISYHFITDSNDTPFFDATELFQKRSEIELALLNRFTDERGEFMVMRVSQAYDTNIGDRPFLPLRLEVGIRRPLSLRFDANYDVHEGELESVNSDIFMTISKATFSLGQRYNKRNDINTLIAGIGITPLKSWNIGGRVWYDADEKEVRELALNIRFAEQCWGAYMEFYKRPGDFTAVIMFDLKGISQGLKI